LAENLENQGWYEEAEELCRWEVTTAKKEYGPNDNSILQSRENLAMVVQK
jgi:hypothetical protein